MIFSYCVERQLQLHVIYYTSQLTLSRVVRIEVDFNCRLGDVYKCTILSFGCKILVSLLGTNTNRTRIIYKVSNHLRLSRLSTIFQKMLIKSLIRGFSNFLTPHLQDSKAFDRILIIRVWSKRVIYIY